MNITSLLKSINLNSIVKGTNTTLKVIKKIIPVYKEVKPFITREKTIFKSDNIIKESEQNSLSNNEYNDTLTFFN